MFAARHLTAWTMAVGLLVPSAVTAAAEPSGADQSDIPGLHAHDGREKQADAATRSYFPDGDVGEEWPASHGNTQGKRQIASATAGRPDVALHAPVARQAGLDRVRQPAAAVPAPQMVAAVTAPVPVQATELPVVAPPAHLPAATAQHALATTDGPPAAHTVADPAATQTTESDMPAPPVLDEDAAREAAQELTRAFRHEVPQARTVSAAYKAEWVELARQQIEQAGYTIDRPQVIVVVDRNPTVQRLCLILALPNTQEWQVIGSTNISTGRTGHKHYYITPTGVFTNTADRLGYRALGTKNENGIMGNGTKGMRVWDFGWQIAEKGWLPSREKGPIRLEMHATDPVFLEQRLGHMASAGCIRIPAALNIFIDRHGLLDVEYERKAAVDRRFKALLRADRTPSPISGLAVVVVDTAGQVQDAGKTAALKDQSPRHQPATNG